MITDPGHLRAAEQPGRRPPDPGDGAGGRWQNLADQWPGIGIPYTCRRRADWNARREDSLGWATSARFTPLLAPGTF